MTELKKILELHIEKYGILPLTNLELLRIIQQTHRYIQRKQTKEDRFLDQLTAECTDLNG